MTRYAGTRRAFVLLLLAPVLLVGCDTTEPEVPRDRFTVRVVAAGKAADINDRGELAFTARLPDGGRRAALWDGTDTTLLPVSTPGATTSAVAINGRGDVLGFDPRPVVWRRDGEVVALETDLVEPGDRVAPADINDAGIVVGSAGRFAPIPVRWSANGAATVVDAPLNGISAINDRGAMVGEDVFIGPDGTVIVLERISVPPSAADVNEEGLVVGDRSPGSLLSDAVVWDPPGVVARVGPHERTDFAIAVNDHGEVVSWGMTVAGGRGSSRFSFDRPPYDRPLILDTLLAGERWRIDRVHGIDNSARIAATVFDGGPEGFRAAILIPGSDLVAR